MTEKKQCKVTHRCRCLEVTQSSSWWHTRCQKVKSTWPRVVLPAGVACDSAHMTRSGMAVLWGMLPHAFTASIRCLWWTGTPQKCSSILKTKRVVTAGYTCVISDLLTDLETFRLLSPPATENLVTPQDERQARKRRNGAENWREIKWIDKVRGIWEKKKWGKWIDCDRREREKEESWRWGGEEWCYWYTAERGDAIFSSSKCYRRTYITVTALWPRQAHKKHTAFISSPTDSY